MTCEACGHQQSMAEDMSATTGAAPGPIGTSESEADDDMGEGDPEPEPAVAPATGGKVEEHYTRVTHPKKEAAAPKETTMAETAPATTMTEADRMELESLRAREAKRGALAAAKKKIRESGVFMKPERLITFAPEQWDAVLDLATQGPRYGTVERPFTEAEPPARRGTGSAADVFRQRFNGGLH